MTEKAKPLSRGVIYALAAAAGLGAITTQAKIIYSDGGNALTVIFWRFTFSIILIGLIVLLKKQSFQISKGRRTPVFLLGFVWSGAMICYLLSVQTISVSLAVLILYSYPLMVMLISLFTGKMKLTGWVVAAFILAFIGIGLMLGGGKIVTHPLGITFAVLAASGAAFTFIKGGDIAPTLNPVVLTFWVNFVGIFLVIPLVWDQFSMPKSNIGLICLIGATLCYIVAMLAQFAALAIIPAAKAAFIFNLEPVVSILLAVIFLSESLSQIQWMGAGIVVTVLFLFSYMGNNNQGKSIP